MLAALPVLASAAPYQQGGSATATVDAGERVEKIDTITAAIKKDGKPDRKSPVGTSEKDFNRSGNPVRIIWYGNPNDADSKIYLKTGISRVAEYNAPTARSDDYEHIDRIENGAGGTHRINGQTYTITAPLTRAAPTANTTPAAPCATTS